MADEDPIADVAGMLIPPSNFDKCMLCMSLSRGVIGGPFTGIIETDPGEFELVHLDYEQVEELAQGYTDPVTGLKFTTGVLEETDAQVAGTWVFAAKKISVNVEYERLVSDGSGGYEAEKETGSATGYRTCIEFSTYDQQNEVPKGIVREAQDEDIFPFYYLDSPEYNKQEFEGIQPTIQHNFIGNIGDPSANNTAEAIARGLLNNFYIAFQFFLFNKSPRDKEPEFHVFIDATFATFDSYQRDIEVNEVSEDKIEFQGYAVTERQENIAPEGEDPVLVTREYELLRKITVTIDEQFENE